MVLLISYQCVQSCEQDQQLILDVVLDEDTVVGVKFGT